MTSILSEKKQSNFPQKFALSIFFPVLLLWIPTGETGVFEFINDEDEVDIITHPTGYNGAGVELVVTVARAIVTACRRDGNTGKERN